VELKFSRLVPFSAFCFMVENFCSFSSADKVVCVIDVKCTFGNEGGLDRSSEGWLANCLTGTEMHHSSGETSVP